MDALTGIKSTVELAEERRIVLRNARHELILDDIASGVTMTSACRRNGLHPIEWLQRVAADPDRLGVAYTEAKAAGCDVMADECIAIADGELPSDMDYRADAQRAAELLGSGSSATTRLLAGAGLELARDRMRIDTRLRLLPLWDIRYNPKSQVELTGKDGGPIEMSDKGTAIALAEQFREMKRARVASPAQLEHSDGADGDGPA